MSALLLLTSALQPSAEVLPALALLPHSVKVLPAEGSALLEAPPVDLVLVDGRQDLVTARDLTRLLRTVGTESPVMLIVSEGGLSVAAVDWGFDELVLVTAGPAEVEARIRLAIARRPDDSAAYSNLGNALYTLGEREGDRLRPFMREIRHRSSPFASAPPAARPLTSRRGTAARRG